MPGIGQLSYLFFFNPSVTDCLFLFLTKNNFNREIDKKELINGAKYLLKYMIILFFEEKSIQNFLSFLEIDCDKSRLLIAESLKSRNSSSLLDFLENYNY